MSLEQCTGRGIRVAVIDSGVHAAHPHVGGVAGGVAIDPDGNELDDYLDRLGHGTAVAAAIRDLVPDAELFAVRVFDRTLSTSIGQLVQAIDWAARSRMDVANLSLGTPRAEHEMALRAALDRAAASGLIVVAARDDDGVRYLPGSMAGVVPVQVDWSCPRHQYHLASVDGVTVVRASGLPRPIPGVPPSKNLHGVSFAVANATAFVTRALETAADRSAHALFEALERHASAAAR